ncbi:MAG: hypothetical protein CME06_04585 [Gemmatimonadetes bacterium]|nr:hypothetical protein [Gemmatimonadota bacterium]
MAPHATAIIPLLFLSTTPTFGAGGSTHFQIADRSRSYVDRASYPDLHRLIRRDYPKIYRHASYFPDWGYAVPGAGDFGEEAHWPPFQYAAMDHLIDHYPEPWSEHAEKLFTFIAGLTCHGEADDAWHFGDTAFLRVATDEDQPIDGAWRTDIEVGCDMFVQVEKRWWFLEHANWWVPVDDLLLIYADLGHTEVAAEQIELGVSLLHTAIALEDMFAWSLYLPFKLRLPWSNANYLDWWDGGVRNDAELSALRMQELWDYKAGDPSSSEPRTDTGTMWRHPRARLPMLAAELVRDGILSPLVRREAGALIVGPLVIIDSTELERRMGEM